MPFGVSAGHLNFACLLQFIHILSVGGSGYFREGFISPQLESGALEVVREAPVFPYPAYLVSAAPGDPGTISVIRGGIRSVAVRQGVGRALFEVL